VCRNPRAAGLSGRLVWGWGARGGGNVIKPCDYSQGARLKRGLLLRMAWREQNKGVSPARKIVSVARSKVRAVTRYRSAFILGRLARTPAGNVPSPPTHPSGISMHPARGWLGVAGARPSPRIRILASLSCLSQPLPAGRIPHEQSYVSLTWLPPPPPPSGSRHLPLPSVCVGPCVCDVSENMAEKVSDADAVLTHCHCLANSKDFRNYVRKLGP
jgi:hypothetical protein